MPVISKPVFEYYSVLPAELRIMIVDEMEPRDRCRFTRCSILSKKEAEASKNFIYCLRIGEKSEDLFQFEIEYGSREHHNGDAIFFIHSRSVENKTIADSFKSQLKMHQNKIKKLDIGYSELKIDFEIENLGKLEELILKNNTDVLKFFSKIRKPLRTLAVYGEGSNQIPVDWEGIYQVRQSLILPSLKFTYAQFLQFTARNINTHIGCLTEEDVFNFIQCWQQTTEPNEKYYDWKLKNSNFSIPKLFKLLDAPHPNTESYHLEIRHKREDRRYGLLTVRGDDTLKFAADWKKQTLNTHST